MPRTPTLSTEGPMSQETPQSETNWEGLQPLCQPWVSTSLALLKNLEVDGMETCYKNN